MVRIEYEVSGVNTNIELNKTYEWISITHYDGAVTSNSQKNRYEKRAAKVRLTVATRRVKCSHML